MKHIDRAIRVLFPCQNRWTVQLDPRNQKIVYGYLVNSLGLKARYARTVLVAWKSARKHLAPDSANYSPFSLNKTSKAVFYAEEYDPEDDLKVIREARRAEIETDRFIVALETSLPKIVASDPELGHNCRLLLAIFYVTRVLGQRPQQMLVPRKTSDPLSKRDYHEFFGGKRRGNRRQAYASYWNCRDIRTVTFSDGERNSTCRFAEDHSVRCKGDRNEGYVVFSIYSGSLF